MVALTFLSRGLPLVTEMEHAWRREPVGLELYALNIIPHGNGSDCDI